MEVIQLSYMIGRELSLQPLPILLFGCRIDLLCRCALSNFADMQFTPQQLAGAGRYHHKTRIGNWNEDAALEEVMTCGAAGRPHCICLSSGVVGVATHCCS